jgi:hypothetical protein
MTSEGAREPVVVEPVVNGEKLRELLALETEYTTLDFKQPCDLGDPNEKTRHRVELAKDVGAMSVRGGYIVVGVDGHGRPADAAFTAEQAALFDEARLRPILLKWLPDTLEISTQTHEIDGRQVVLVYVAPNPAGCAFFKATGQYLDGKEPKVVFRAGEVFYRDGTQSTRLSQQGLEQIIARRVQDEQAKWENEHAASYRHLADQLRTGSAGQQVARGPAVEFNLALESDVLTAAAVELLRSNDDIPLRLLFTRAGPAARNLYQAGSQGEIAGVLDRLACLAATFLELDRAQWFRRAVDAMLAVYNTPFQITPAMPDTPPGEAAELWLTVIERVFALGSLAVQRENWPAVRLLAAQQPLNPYGVVLRGWLTHAMVMATRAGLLQIRQGDQQVLLSLLSLARETVRRLDCLHPDMEADDERILTGLTQFDFLACLVTLAQPGGGSPYPDFARYRSQRTQPVAERLIGDPVMREVIFPGDDQHLAIALHELDSGAQRAGFRYDGWEGYGPRAREFVKQHLPEQTS